jgi:hypothetical protein
MNADLVNRNHSAYQVVMALTWSDRAARCLATATSTSCEQGSGKCLVLEWAGGQQTG